MRFWTGAIYTVFDILTENQCDLGIHGLRSTRMKLIFQYEIQFLTDGQLTGCKRLQLCEGKVSFLSGLDVQRVFQLPLFLCI